MPDTTKQPGLPEPRPIRGAQLRWRHVFPGEERQLAVMRSWIAALLPPCPARDDVAAVATELASNAVRHTASGRDGGWFAMEITWHRASVLVAVADGGGPAEPHVIHDPNAEGGRGLLLVRGLSMRTGFSGDARGRLAWAQVRWEDTGPATHPAALDPYEAAIHDGEAALARRFAQMPAWFGRSTLTWWAIAWQHGLVSAPSAQDLAGLLYRLRDTPAAPHTSLSRQFRHGSVHEETVPTARKRTRGGGPAAHRNRPVGDQIGPGHRAQEVTTPAPRPLLVPHLAAPGRL